MRAQVKSILSSTYLVYGLLLVAHVALVWMLPYFPTQDGPSHLYNLVILKDLLNGGQVWGDFYVSRLSPLPNLGFHIIAYPLLTLFSPAITEKIFITIYILGMVISVPVFVRSFNRPVFPFSFLVFPVLFNFNLMMGFYSYVIAVPIFLLAFACCYRLRSASLLLRFTIYNLVGFVVYYIHLIAFGMFLLSLAAIVISESYGVKDMLRKAGKLMFLISPLLFNLFGYILSTSDLTSIPLTYIPWSDRIFDLLTLSCVTLSSWQRFHGCLLFCVFISLLTFGVCREMPDNRQDNHSRIFPATNVRCLLYVSLALFLICLLSPFNLGAGSYFNQRFPWVILLVLIPILHVPARYVFARFSSGILVSISVLFFVGNAVAMLQKNSIIEEYLKGLSVDFPRGAYIMSYRTERDFFRVDVLSHAASYYGVEKNAFIFGNYEATEKHFPISFNTPLPALPQRYQIYYDVKSIDWARFPAVQYLLIWENTDLANEKISGFYRKIFNSGNLNVWQRRGGQGAE